MIDANEIILRPSDDAPAYQRPRATCIILVTLEKVVETSVLLTGVEPPWMAPRTIGILYRTKGQISPFNSSTARYTLAIHEHRGTKTRNGHLTGQIGSRGFGQRDFSCRCRRSERMHALGTSKAHQNSGNQANRHSALLRRWSRQTCHRASKKPQERLSRSLGGSAVPVLVLVLFQEV